MKQAMQKSKDASGIMSLNKNLVKDVDNTVKKWIESAKVQGQDIDKMGEQEIKYIVELNKKPKINVISQDDVRFKEITDKIFGKKGEVVDMTGKTIQKPENIMGGMEDIKNKMSDIQKLSDELGKMSKGYDSYYGLKKSQDVVTETVTKITTMEPVAAMKEANLVISRKGKYKNLTKEQSQKILKETDDWIFQRDPDDLYDYNKKRPFRDDPDTEDFAQGGRTGGGLNYLLGEDDQNVRMPFKEGHSAGRRKFLKVAAGLATIPIVGKFFKFAKPLAKTAKVADVTSVPIGNAAGMPAWFKPLVNKVIKEGDDVTKKFATGEREIVHTKKLDEFDEVTVYQDLNNGNVRVEYHGSGNMGEAPIQLDYKAGEMLEGPIKKGQPSKTKSEFSAVESEPEIVNWDGDIEWTGENSVSKVDDLLTDTTKLETYATGNKPNIKQLLKSEQKQKHINKLHDDQMEQVNYIENKHGPAMEYIDEGARVGDFDPKGYRNYDTKGINLPSKIKKASGGRVPLSGGGGIMKVLKLLKSKPKKSYERIDLQKLLKEKKKIPVYSGSMKRSSNTWKSFVEDAEKLGTTPEKIAKDKFKGQWFTPYRDYAESFMDPKDLTSKMRTVDLTPKEIAIAKRYVKKVNKKDIISMRKKLGIKDAKGEYPKQNITTSDNLVLIPKYKLKKLKKEKRIMTDYLIKDKIKAKLGLAEGGRVSLSNGGVAGMLGE